MTVPGTSSESPGPLLGAVVVHWNNEDELVDLLEAWSADVPVVVVDNSSSLDRDALSTSAAGVADGPMPFSVVDPGRNLGFGAGVDRGVQELAERWPRVEWVLVLNPDARPRPGALDILRAACARSSDAGVVPALEHEDGRSQCQWQLQPLPTALDLLLQVFFLGGRRGPAAEPAEGTVIGQPAAAALALRRSVLEAVGGFGDRYYPAWFEDVDLAARLHTADHRLRYAPSSRFVHTMGGSVPSLGYGVFSWLYYRHLLLYLRRHHGVFWSGLARALLPLSMLLRCLLLPVRKPSRAVSRRHALAALRDVALGAISGWRRPKAFARRFVPGGASSDREVSEGL